MNENWTDNLRQQMEQYESTQVPEGLWEGIEQCLDSSPRTVVVHTWRRWAAACIAVCIIGVAGVMLDPLPTSPRGGEQSNNGPFATSVPRKNTDPGLDLKHKVTEIKSFSSSRAQNSAKLYASVPMSSVSDTECKSNDEETVMAATVEHRLPKPYVADTGTQNAESASENRPSPSHPYYHDEAVNVTHGERKRASGGGVRVALYTSQMSESKDLGMEGYLALSANGTPDNTPHLLSKGNKGNMDYMSLANYGENPVTNAHHQQPVRIGFSVGYDINRRWGVNVGVAYTRLKSTLTAGTEHSYYSNDQTINYIGVPVSVNYNLLSSRHLRLYATAGGMVELGAGGKTVVNTITRNSLVATENHELDDIPVQLSANIGGGAELNVYRSLGIFAEVGAAYYLDNNSKYATIYSTHPLNLNIQFGVRWTINSKE